MSLDMSSKKARRLFSAGFAMALGWAALPAFAQEPTLSDEAFESSKQLYFEQCAGCHGVLRKGSTGVNLEPHWKKTAADGTVTEGGTMKLGQNRLEKIISIRSC